MALKGNSGSMQLPLCAITIVSNWPQGFPFSLKCHIPLNGSSALIQQGLTTLTIPVCTNAQIYIQQKRNIILKPNTATSQRWIENIKEKVMIKGLNRFTTLKSNQDPPNKKLDG